MSPAMYLIIKVPNVRVLIFEYWEAVDDNRVQYVVTQRMPVNSDFNVYSRAIPSIFERTIARAHRHQRQESQRTVRWLLEVLKTIAFD